MNYFIDGITKHYADFSGRARRKEYWMYVLFNFLAGLIARFFDALHDPSTGFTKLGILSIILYIGLFLPTCAVSVRRLHDVGKSGWFMIIPFFNVILALSQSVPEKGE